MKIKIHFLCYWGVRLASGVPGTIGAVAVPHDAEAASVLLEDVTNGQFRLQRGFEGRTG